jgi:peptide/nickel transport system permease protein
MQTIFRRLTFASTASALVLLICVLGAILAPLLAPFGEGDMVGPVWGPPSSAHLLGLDNLGRDILTRLLYGARTTLLVATMTTLIAFVCGGFFGFAAGIAGGWLDAFLSRSVDIMMSVPGLVVSLLVLCLVGTSIPTLILTVAAIESLRVFRLTRGVAAGIAKLEYLEAARLRGESLPSIVVFEVLPNAFIPLLAAFGLSFTYTVLFIAALSFLGLGIQPPAADWGGMVRDNAPAIGLGAIAPVVPAVAIAALTVSANVLVDWLLSIRGERNAW